MRSRCCLSFCGATGLWFFGKASFYAIECHPNSATIPKSFQLICLDHLRNTALGNAEHFGRARRVNFANSVFVGIDRDNNNFTAIFGRLPNVCFGKGSSWIARYSHSTCNHSAAISHASANVAPCVPPSKSYGKATNNPAFSKISNSYTCSMFDLSFTHHFKPACFRIASAKRSPISL